MKDYLNKWTISRAVQLFVGAVFLNAYFADGDFFALAFGGLMTFQAVWTVGCFSIKGCATNASSSIKKMAKKERGEIEVSASC